MTFEGFVGAKPEALLQAKFHTAPPPAPNLQIKSWNSLETFW